MKKLTLLCFLFIFGNLFADLPEEYEVTDISAWSAAQLVSVPYFDRFVPVGASGDYSPIAQSGFGATAGNRDFNNGSWVQGSGAFLKNGVVTSIPAWLREGVWYSYAWSRTWWDGDDVHFQSGFKTHSPVRDINALGQIVGYATVPGSGGSSLDYRDHAYLRDTVTGEHIDLTPLANRADPLMINDLGEIIGTWGNDDGTHAFRRAPDGMFSDFVLAEANTSHSMTPTVLNNRGQVAGTAVVYTVPDRDRRLFYSESGTTTVRLPFPSQNSPDTGDVYDINEHGVMVGVAYRYAKTDEKNGVRWAKVGNNWEAEDFNELLADHEPEVIIDSAIAINDAGYVIVKGHLDGTDIQNTRTILLSPDVPAKPAVTTLRSIVGSTTATLRAKINAADDAASYHFVHGLPGANGSGSASGTAPVMAELELTGLLPNTTYSYHATATNGEGATVGGVQTFTTLWDWPSWSATQGMMDPNGDANGNSLPDLVDFATGRGSAPAVELDQGLLKLTYRRSHTAVDVILKVQVSDDMFTWVDAVAEETILTPDGADGEIVTFCIDASMSRRFTRLIAIMP